MDKLRVYLIKGSQTFEGTTAEVCAQIDKQINSDLMSLSKEKTHETVDK
jgi:flavodoxin